MSNNQQQGLAEALIEKIQTDVSEEAAKIRTTATEQAEAITQELAGKRA